MDWPKLLVLVRHAESGGNVRSVDERAECNIAAYDYALTPRGREQARITGEWLHKNYGDFPVKYVSYYRRSCETMEIMYPNSRAYEDPRLAEAQRGMYHTMTRKELKRRYPEELKRKDREGLYHYRPFGGENWPDVELRIHSFLDSLRRDHAGGKVLMVVHGHWLILFQRIMHRFSIKEALDRYHNHVAPNASVTVYKTVRIKSFNLIDEEPIVPWKGKIPPTPPA